MREVSWILLSSNCKCTKFDIISKCISICVYSIAALIMIDQISPFSNIDLVLILPAFKESDTSYSLNVSDNFLQIILLSLSVQET